MICLFSRQRPGNRWFPPIIVRYVLYQLPALLLVIAGAAALVRWFDVQPWIAVAVVLVWAIKDAVLYPLTWKAYDRDRRDDAHTMVGKCGTARERLDPDGYVVVDGELWRARLERACRPVQKGCPVIVKRIEGLTLVVEYQQNVPG